MKRTNSVNFNPLVSIIIPVYNGSNYVKEAIDSALAQTYKNIEIIVVNDGSTDNTEEIVKSYGNKLRYFKKENGGVATALNLGVKKMKGEYFSWLSHDDVYYPDKIEIQTNELKKLNDKTTVLYGDFNYIGDDSRILEKKIISNKYKKEQLNKPLYSLMNGILNGCTMLIKKDLLIKNGLFKEELLTTQDYDLWFKILRKNKIYYINKPLIKSRDHKDQESKFLSEIHSKEGNELWKYIISSLTKQEIRLLDNDQTSFFIKMFSRLKLMKLNNAAHEAIIRALLIKNDKKNTLLITATVDGGLGRFVNDLSMVLNNDFNVYTLYPNGNSVKLFFNNLLIIDINISSAIYWDDMYENEELAGVVLSLIKILKINIVHINGFIFIGFKVLLTIKELFGIPVLYTTHDFQLLCVSQFFLDKDSNYCQMNQDFSICNKCLVKNPYVNFAGNFDNKRLKNYRGYIDKFVIPNLDCIVFPSEFVKNSFIGFYPKIKKNKIVMIEHGIKIIKVKSTEKIYIKRAEKFRIGLIGNLSLHKGLEYVEKIVKKLNKDEYEFFLFGKCEKSLENVKVINVTINDDIITIIKNYSISVFLILSKSPETFSYVLSECWGSGVPVIVPKIGTLEERLKKNGGGFLVNTNKIIEESLLLIENLKRNPNLLKIEKEKVVKIKLKTLESMGMDYCNLYKKLIKKVGGDFSIDNKKDVYDQILLLNLFNKYKKDNIVLQNIINNKISIFTTIGDIFKGRFENEKKMLDKVYLYPVIGHLLVRIYLRIKKILGIYEK